MAASGSQWDGRVSAKHYAVACIDILGQRAEFAKLPRFLKDGTTTEEALPVLQRTYGRVHQFRHDFVKLFKDTNERLSGIAWKDAIGGACSSNGIAAYSFADTVVAYMRFGPEPANCYGVTAMVAVSGLLLMSFLARGIAVRGGVEVDVASPIGDNEVYGPALIEAHRLENEVARHPRIVAGKGLLEYLQWAAQRGSMQKADAMTTACAGDCLKLLFRDNDGQFAVDHLGSVVDIFSDGIADWPGLARQAAAFVKSQQAHYAAHNDEKLASRYTEALRYCDSRSTVWERDPDPATAQERLRQRRVDEQRRVYDATGDFLTSRGVDLREMSYNWVTGRVSVGVEGTADPSVSSALRAHLQKLGLVVSTITIGTKK